MVQPRVLILRAPGTNCDVETAFAFQRAGAVTQRLHIGRLLEKPGLIDEYQILCLPGGFSYGDDLGAGTILASQIRHHLLDALHRFKAAGKLVLGICNGFQILIKSGILLEQSSSGSMAEGPPATLTANASGKFEDRWVHLRAQGGKCVCFAGIDSMYLPVAHAEGRFVARDPAVLAALEANGQLALRYCRDPESTTATGPVPYPENPNGAMADVAGVCDATGRVCGLMPHPERHIDPTHHPRWTRRPSVAEGDGLRVFRNAVGYFT